MILVNGMGEILQVSSLWALMVGAGQGFVGVHSYIKCAVLKTICTVQELTFPDANLMIYLFGKIPLR